MLGPTIRGIEYFIREFEPVDMFFDVEVRGVTGRVSFFSSPFCSNS